MKVISETQPGGRLRQCLDAGSVVALFPLLSDWTADDLLALLGEIDSFYEAERKRLAEIYGGLVFKPEIFFSRKASVSLDRARDDAGMNLVACLAEIASVAMHYLPRHDAAEREA